MTCLTSLNTVLLVFLFFFWSFCSCRSRNSYIYKKELNISSVSNALSLVLVSSQFMLHELCRASLTFLQQNASPSNVLDILAWLRRVRPAPGLPAQEAEAALCELLTKCHAILDANADTILQSDSVDNLEHEMLIEMLSRDTLKLSSESVAFDCLQRWACQQCLKQRRALTADNKRDILGKAIYAIRYLTMSLDEFTKGPYAADVLADDDKAVLLAKLRGHPASLPLHLVGLKLDVARKWSKPTGTVSPSRRAAADGKSSGHVSVNGRPKKSASKKLLNGLSGFMICVIQLLD